MTHEIILPGLVDVKLGRHDGEWGQGPVRVVAVGFSESRVHGGTKYDGPITVVRYRRLVPKE